MSAATAATDDLAGTRVVLVDDSAAWAELVARWLESELGCIVDVFLSPADLIAASPPPGGWRVALVDLTFRGQIDGVDVLLHLARHAPDTLRVVLTAGDEWVSEQVRSTWEALPLATMLTKSQPLSELTRLIAQVARTGAAPIDPLLRGLLPETRSPWRSAESYARLVQHAGHAKLWRALIEFDGEPSYRDLSRATGLSVNTVRNYREQLLPELQVHGLLNPTMRAMQSFAQRCRPFLAPVIAERLGTSTS